MFVCFELKIFPRGRAQKVCVDIKPNAAVFGKQKHANDISDLRQSEASGEQYILELADVDVTSHVGIIDDSYLCLRQKFFFHVRMHS